MFVNDWRETPNSNHKRQQREEKGGCIREKKPRGNRRYASEELVVVVVVGVLQVPNSYFVLVKSQVNFSKFISMKILSSPLVYNLSRITEVAGI